VENRYSSQIYTRMLRHKTVIYYFRRMKDMLLGLILLVSLNACTPSSTDKKVIRSQSELESLLHSWSNTDSLNVPEIAAKYDIAQDEYLENYPGNPVHENFLFLAARRAIGKKDYAKAAGIYGQFSELYPESKSHSDALFGAAFLYNNEVHNLDSARKYYETFLITYPDHLLYDAAKAELEHLGETPEEMLNKMQKALDSLQ